MKTNFNIWSSFCLLLLFAMVTFAQEDNFIDYNAKKGELLKIDLKTGGDLRIIGWNKEKTRISGDFSYEDYEVKTKRTDEGISIISLGIPWDNKKNEQNVNIDLEIYVPQKYNITFTTMGGDVSIENIEGNIKGKTMGGDYILRKLKGHLDLTTMGGEYFVYDSEVSGTVQTMGGDIFLENIIGDLQAHTMGGEVTQKNVRSSEGLKEGKEVVINTMGGDINVDEAKYGAKLKTMGGDISVKKVSKYIEATTLGGDIKLEEVDGRIEASTNGGDVYAKIIEKDFHGKKNIFIKNIGGDITLYLPEDFSMTINAEVKIELNAEPESNIISDFPLDIMKKEIKKRRKILYNFRGKGINGSGKNRVELYTVGGVIRIKKY